MATNTLTQIQRQIARLQAKAKAIENSSNAKKTKAIQKVRALMSKLGVTMADLGEAAPANSKGAAGKAKAPSKTAAKKPGRKTAGKTAVPIRFRDPETGNTWTGRGLPPKWMTEKLKAGKTKEDFRIVESAAVAPATDAAPQAPAV